ncbi:MAG TPA: two-component regulator propeller domain-containing protein [Pseudomonadota bacterium]|nr:two-component regulator propeller domain-containing protein [Pseudomonadota bacterium]
MIACFPLRLLGWTVFGVVVAQPLRAQFPAPLATGSPILSTAPEQVGEYVTEVFRDRRGTLWLGTLTEGLCRHNAQGFRCVGEADGYRSGALRAAVEDAYGHVWFGGQSGLSRFDGKSFTYYSTADGLPSDQIWSLLLDQHGRLWIGTVNGVARFDGERFLPFDLPANTLADVHPRFSTQLAFSLLEDRHGNIWFGTDGVGAVKYDGKSFTRYTHDDGLASNDVSAMVEDGQGDLWFTSRMDGGISRYDGHRFVRYTRSDGLPVDEAWVALRDHRGHLWFGTGGGGVVRYDGRRFEVFQDDSGLTRNHVQSIFEDPDGSLWLGFSGGLFRMDPGSLPSKRPQLVNVTRAGPWR